MKKMLALMWLCMLPIVIAQIPTIDSYVTDEANVLRSTVQEELEKALKSLEQETNGVQFVIYIENQYPKEYSLEEYTLRLAEQNGLGKEQNDNGLLLYVAVKDQVYRWETGYGVESTLNAALLGRISREYMVPAFEEQNYEKGILDATYAVGSILLGSNDPDIIKLLNEESTASENKEGIFIAILVLVIMMILIFSIITSNRKSGGLRSYRDEVYTGAASGLFTGGFGRGGGGFGGGFGGFSGGGGGFGGGGFSGKW